MFFFFRLRIKGFRPKDAGVYSCQNDEERGREMSVTIKHKELQDQDTAGKDNIKI